MFEMRWAVYYTDFSGHKLAKEPVLEYRTDEEWVPVPVVKIEEDQDDSNTAQWVSIIG